MCNHIECLDVTLLWNPPIPLSKSNLNFCDQPFKDWKVERTNGRDKLTETARPSLRRNEKTSRNAFKNSSISGKRRHWNNFCAKDASDIYLRPQQLLDSQNGIFALRLCDQVTRSDVHRRGQLSQHSHLFRKQNIENMKEVANVD